MQPNIPRGFQHRRFARETRLILNHPPALTVQAASRRKAAPHFLGTLNLTERTTAMAPLSTHVFVDGLILSYGAIEKPTEW